MLSRPVPRIIHKICLMPATFLMPVSLLLLSVISIGGATFFSYFYKLLPVFEITHGT
jgi:hypothetical protein